MNFYTLLFIIYKELTYWEDKELVGISKVESFFFN